MGVRNLLYDRDVLKSYELGARTISVGNLTTGGTGKTPLVALIAKIMIERGETVCILTRGYGRKNPKKRVLVSDGTNILADAENGGDEPVELAHKLGGRAIIVADPDRVTAARWACERYEIDTFILDDGFQHRRARRDLDIVCIDATNPCGNGLILPAGILRESFKSLRRANMIVITRTEQGDETSELEERVRTRNPNSLILKARTKLVCLVPIDEFPSDSIRQTEWPEKLVAFTGLGNPDNFFKSLDLANVNAVARESFRDHHRFTSRDIEQVESKAREAGAAALVTTAKDAVKLKGLKFTLPCYVALAQTIIDDPDAFTSLITSS
jgi:tetraacyldisaccharide 4'-kinase